ncbi:MAG: SEC-C domain-containing protein [Oscillospiraceae bacterium]|nr:SEC-C domain-containing protein [Oscillospiraceae bacterium]
MMISKIAVCPICGKRTCLRIQDGGYLSEYPIRVNCMNCRALLKGVYVMEGNTRPHGLTMFNADVEECDVDNSAPSMPMAANTIRIRNADYVAEISGELPCNTVYKYNGGIPLSPFMRSVGNLESMEERIERLKYFTHNMQDWNRTKSTAFQLLDEGSIDYIATALKNKIGSYTYECDHYLKSLHCLQEVVLDETKYLFLSPLQDDCILHLLRELSHVDKAKLHLFANEIGGIQGLLLAYRKAIEVFSNFMSIYPNVLPAETYMRYKDKSQASTGIATCSFQDIKTYYQDAYESLLSLFYVPVGLDNIVLRGDFQKFNSTYDDVNRNRGIRDIAGYRRLDNGTRCNKVDNNETFQGIISIPANRLLRNGIGHNNNNYDGITQTVTAYDLKNPTLVTVQMSLMEMAEDCIGLARSAVILSEIILFVLREEFRLSNITTVIHPRYYSGIGPNDKCPCGSNKKYKSCCRNEFERISR